MKKLTLINLIFLTLLVLNITSCSCNPEKVFQFALQFSNSLRGIEAARSIGQFRRVEANLKKEWGEKPSTIELKLYNGTVENLYENEANIARQCAKAFVTTSKYKDFDEIEVFIIKTNESQPQQTVYKSQYRFEIPSLTREY